LPLVWGIAHLFPTKSVVEGFGEISDDNKKIVTMEWLTAHPSGALKNEAGKQNESDHCCNEQAKPNFKAEFR